MLDAQEKTFKKHNLPIERLNKEQVKEKIPYICDNVIAANFSPMSGYSNPLKAGVAILMKAKSMGCEFYDHQFIKKLNHHQMEKDILPMQIMNSFMQRKF